MSTKKPSQTALYGPILSSSQQYQFDMASYRDINTYSQEEQKRLIHLARQGEKSAREAILTGLLPAVCRDARRYGSSYMTKETVIEYSELVEIGNLALVEKFDVALATEEPISYLIACAQYEMRSYCLYDASVVPIPHGSVYYLNRPQVMSIDTPINEEKGDRLWSECLAMPESSQQETEDYEPLYSAFELLTEKQKNVIFRLYGLCGNAPEGLRELGRALYKGNGTHGGVNNLRNKAFQRLRPVLEKAYVHRLSKVPRPCNDAQINPFVVITVKQEQRMICACQLLETMGQRMTVSAVARIAHVTNVIASTYLKIRAQEQEKQSA